MRPCFYRAPTDNDRGGSNGTSHAARCVFSDGARLRVAGHWRESTEQQA